MKEPELSAQLILQTVEEAVRQGESVIISGSGTSMKPFIRPELDRLLLTPLPRRPLLPGDVVLYRRPGGAPVIHRIYRARGDCFDMLGDNQVRIERNVPRESIVAYLKQVLRPEGSYDCDSKAARKEACKAMERRLNPPRETRLRMYARAAKRRLEKLTGKR